MPPEDNDDPNIGDGSDVYSSATETVEAPELPAGSETTSDPSESESSNHEASPPADGEQSGEGEQQQKPVVQQRPVIDERAIAEIVARQTAAALQPKQAPAQPQLTPEQITALLKPVRVTAEQLKHFGIENATPEQLAGIQQFLEQPAQNAIAVAKLMMEHQQQQFIRENQHIVEYYNKQQADAHRNNFFQTNEDLKGFEDVVELVANKVSEHNPDGSLKSDAQLMKEVATASRAVLTKYGVQLKPAQPANHGAGSRKSNVPTMPSLQRPGRSLGAPANGGANNPDADIYT